MKSQIEIEALEAIKRAAIIEDKERINNYIATLKCVPIPHTTTIEGEELLKKIQEIISTININ